MVDEGAQGRKKSTFPLLWVMNNDVNTVNVTNSDVVNARFIYILADS